MLLWIGGQHKDIEITKDKETLQSIRFAKGPYTSMA